MIPGVKICGLTDYKTACWAEDLGASMIGFVFFEKSPRHVEPETARDIAARLSGRASLVALTVNLGDEAIATIVNRLKPHYIQCHGGESPARVEAIKRTFDLPVIKAFSISDRHDFEKTKGFECADIWLFDAKPDAGSRLPGGNGQAFDWQLLKDFLQAKQRQNGIMLSGGLAPDNVGQAMNLINSDYLDVSSGVETHPGVKDLGLIQAFLETVQQHAKGILHKMPYAKPG